MTGFIDQRSMSMSTYQRFHSWRSLTASICEAAIRIQDTKLGTSCIAEQILGVLSPYAVQTSRLKPELEDLLYTAVVLDRTISQQLAEMVIYYPDEQRRKISKDSPEIFIDCYQAPNPPRSDSPVRLIVTPGLLKYGTASGEPYDQSQLLHRCYSFQHSTVNGPSVSTRPISRRSTDVRPGFRRPSMDASGSRRSSMDKTPVRLSAYTPSVSSSRSKKSSRSWAIPFFSSKKG
jgi:hypothetical protein